MFIIRRVLIANRGEIAVRVIRTCRRLGIETVLAVTATDADAVPARLADKTIEITSYLDADTVIGIVETMKLMNSVPAGVAGVVAGFCVANAEFAARGAALLRIRAER